MDKYFTIIALSVANLKQYVEFLELISFNKIHIISTKLNRNLCHATKITILYKDSTMVALDYGNHLYYRLGHWFL